MVYLYVLFHFDNFWVSGFHIHLVRTQKIYVHTKWMAHYVEVYIQFESCFKVSKFGMILVSFLI